MYQSSREILPNHRQTNSSTLKLEFNHCPEKMSEPSSVYIFFDPDCEVGKWANPSGTAILGQPMIKPEQAP
jgi:hypothetical protein